MLLLLTAGCNPVLATSEVVCKMMSTWVITHPSNNLSGECRPFTGRRCQTWLMMLKQLSVLSGLQESEWGS